MRLTELARPFLCCVLLDDRNPDALTRTIRLAEAGGAHAFELNLQVLESTYDPAALAPVFAATARPVYTVFRRYDAMEAQPHSLAPEDERRIDLQLELLNHGSVGFDMELDTFDPYPGPWFRSDEGIRYSHDPTSPPREVSHDPEADRRQREIIERAHELGGEVILSTHALTRLPVDEAVAIGRLAESRGADIAKIVRLCTSDEDVIETLEAVVALRRALTIPFIMMGTSPHGRITRLLAPLFGSLLVFCRQTYSPGSFLDQPLLSTARTILDTIDTSVPPSGSSFLPAEV